MQQTAMKTPYVASSLPNAPSERTPKKGVRFKPHNTFSFQDRWTARSSKLF